MINIPYVATIALLLAALGGYAPIQDTVKSDIMFTRKQMPEFPGGHEEVNKYITANLKYPKTAIDDCTQGCVFVQLIILKTLL